MILSVGGSWGHSVALAAVISLHKPSDKFQISYFQLTEAYCLMLFFFFPSPLSPSLKHVHLGPKEDLINDLLLASLS